MSDTSQTTTKKREAQSDKAYVNRAGSPVEIDSPEAIGLLYKELGPSGKSVLIDYEKMTPAVQKMNALFGISTLATNQASWNRNQAKAEEAFASDADAVEARFARMEDGNWGLKPGGGRLLIDVDILAGVVTDAGFAPPDPTAFKAALTADATLRDTLRNHPQISAEYDKRIREKKAAAAAAPADLSALLAKAFATPAPAPTPDAAS